MLRKSLAIIFASVFILSAEAAERDQGTRLLQDILRERQQRALESAPPNQQIQSRNPEGPVSESPCFLIDNIQLDDITIFSTKQTMPIIKEFSSRCLGQLSVNNLLSRVNKLYADAGYITSRAYLPSQDLSSKTLIIKVLEGKIEEFSFQQINERNEAKLGPSRKITMAMPQKAGDVFQLRDLEQGLEQMNRLASSMVSANLVAGSAPGTSKVLITEKKTDPVRGTFGISFRDRKDVDLDPQVSIGMNFDDLLSLNEGLAVSYSGAKNSNAVAFDFSVPFQNWFSSTSGSYSEELEALTVSSELFTQTLNFEQSLELVLLRTNRSKYFAYGSISSYSNRRYINIVELTPQHRASMSLGVRQEHRFEIGQISASAGMSFGSRAFGADWDPENLPKNSPHASFSKFEGQFTYGRAFQSGQQLSLFLSGQVANYTLYSNEQISIGGWDSVRGFAGVSASGENGIYLRSDYYFPPIGPEREAWPTFKKLNFFNLVSDVDWYIRPSIFVDAGTVRSLAIKQNTEFFSGGMGLVAQIGDLSLSGTVANPLNKVATQEAGDVQFYFGVSWKVF